MAIEEVRAAVRAAQETVHAKMGKSGSLPGPDGWFPAKNRDDDKDDFAFGTYWNCAETALTITEPAWAAVDAFGKLSSLCKEDTDTCKMSKAENSLGAVEAALAAIGYFMDIPNDCLGFTCAYKTPVIDTKEWVDPEMRGVTRSSAMLDMLTAASGITGATLAKILQCDDKLGDSLVAFLSDKNGGKQWIHPVLGSYWPTAWEIRAMVQFVKSFQRGGLKWSRGEIILAMLERIAGAVQSTSEAKMDIHSAKGETPESAEMGCKAAFSHITASVMALLAGFAKYKACTLGEAEVPQAFWTSTTTTIAVRDRCTIPESKQSRQYKGRCNEFVKAYDALTRPDPDNKVMAKAKDCFDSCCQSTDYAGSDRIAKSNWCRQKPPAQMSKTVEGWWDE